MIAVEKYTQGHKCLWDNFIQNSTSGIFLFQRDYMEYHSDRFNDFSLLFFENKGLIAVMPAHIKGDTLFSHSGLTFGGIVSDGSMKATVMLEIFSALKETLKKEGIKKVLYKAVPYIYHDIPADEGLYALYVNEAKLVRREPSSAVALKTGAGYAGQKKEYVSKEITQALAVQRRYDFNSFMSLLEELLAKKYNKKPTHSAREIQLLAEKFPENIKLYTADKDGNISTGIIMYESRNVAHAQYMASTEEGKKISAASFLTNFLINKYINEKKYFDFGISTENNGFYLNTGLISFKEKFGARVVLHDFYEMDIK